MLTICASGNIMLYPLRTILPTRNGNKEVPGKIMVYSRQRYALNHTALHGKIFYRSIMKGHAPSHSEGRALAAADFRASQSGDRTAVRHLDCRERAPTEYGDIDFAG